MNLLVTHDRNKEETSMTLPNGSDGFKLLEELSLNPDEVILLRDDAPIPLDDPLHDGDALRILVVVSGG